jgi:hypothetical protein
MHSRSRASGTVRCAAGESLAGRRRAEHATLREAGDARKMVCTGGVRASALTSGNDFRLPSMRRKKPPARRLPAQTAW